MTDRDTKQKELKQLEKFILGPGISGYVTHLWFESLRNKYPYEYFLFLKKHRNEKKEPAELEAEDNKIIAAFDVITKMKARLNKYFIFPPEDNDQKKEFDMLITQLEKLLSKQNKEN